MTRINLVPVEELSDQHLMAEYRELPRMASFAEKTVKKVKDIPKLFKLNTGHMVFFLNKGTYLEDRHKEIVAELKHRGFNLTIKEPFKMNRRFLQDDEWKPTYPEIQVSRQRIQEKLDAKPNFYRWTKYKE
jgi:deoxyribonuclease (pyrimidine dimer)